jgi:hypothetical protein
MIMSIDNEMREGLEESEFYTLHSVEMTDEPCIVAHVSRLPGLIKVKKKVVLVLN